MLIMTNRQVGVAGEINVSQLFPKVAMKEQEFRRTNSIM